MDSKSTHETRSSGCEEDEKEYPPLKIRLPAMAAIYLAVFLVAIDRTIIGTAIPTISSYFDSFGDIGWYESGFLLPLCILQLSFGRVYRYYSTKWVLFTLVAIFEIGSIICASAPNSNALIVGRVITGIGGTGIASGSFVLISLLVPLQSRPKYTGGLGAVFGISSIIGPVLGGYLTSITWRWCFWINVPIGGVSLTLLLLLTPNTPPPVKRADSWRNKISELDPLGFILIGPAVICLLFAVQWGGIKYPWSDGRVIALFVVFGVLFLAFAASQVWRKDNATIPPQILLQRSILSAVVASIGIGTVLVLYAFFLPIWFQVIQGKSPQSSGLSLLPLLLSNVLAVIGGGIATSLLGYYTPLMIIGSVILIVGSALITTWQVTTGAGTWIGYQILTGVGLGLVLQQPAIAAQTVLADSDVSIGLSLLNFVQFFGGTIFVTVSQSLLENKLVRGLQGIIPDLDPSSLANGGATTLRNMASGEQLAEVLVVYNDSIRSIWYLALGLSCLILVGSLGMEWKSVKSKKSKSKEQEKASVAVNG